MINVQDYRSFALDQSATIHAIVNALNSELRPIHYREAYGRFAKIDPSLKPLGEKTDGAEKVRQWFSETDRGVYVDRGNLYLNDWLSGEKDQLFRNGFKCLPLDQSVREECLYQAGRRHDYMLDKKGTANTDTGVKDRKRRALIEWSVAETFKAMFQSIYIEPANYKDYKAPCDHDFALNFGVSKKKFDVKEFTRDASTIITNVKDDVVYVFAKWKQDHAEMIGYIPGVACHELRDIPFRRFSAKEATIRDLTGIATLLVYLNMRMRGESLIRVRERYNGAMIAKRYRAA